ncbi:NAD(P)-dependent alcohol dehydrogenase [Novosphingobium sp. Gsoil 351]|uniref:NAD(P)-dependent alcohol dehydrogenase n=1 Tax=Novosphingobium sp. Gsoil 351 TaxID=2675225 RepID=UPI0012B4FC16|nr:NAD(P)-dependent alcohol dehydrogenase [Novosphingobium sp. Gsoil 351]QGN55309.1 alcohol dehydrogenase catalytic domain-containing protein [Novosphingobium sp. Gsoil 351]
MTATAAWGATAPESGLAPLTIDRRNLRDEDVAIDIAFCGVCHSDLHAARNDWGRTTYPLVPGHEIVGTVSAVGSGVTRFKAGDRVAIGTIVDSCRHCDACVDDEEQYCREGMTGTYNARDRVDGTTTYGGYSKSIVVAEPYVLRIPDGLDLARAAPLLCAGITTYSPLRNWGVGPGSRVGVIGLGGLGHMGVKFAKALGAEVTMITTSPEKGADAQRLGADKVLVSSDKAAMKAATRSFDFLLDTIPVAHEMTPYLQLLDRKGTLCIVGAIDMLPSFHTGVLLMKQGSVAGSGVGGIAQTQEMLDLCAQKGILAECEVIPMDGINAAFERMEKADVKYRFVIDMSTL